MKTDQTASVIRALLCGLNYRCAAGEQRRKQLERFFKRQHIKKPRASSDAGDARKHGRHVGGTIEGDPELKWTCFCSLPVVYFLFLRCVLHVKAQLL